VSEIIFEWNSDKAQTNESKHGVSFEEAETAFYDQNARVSYDSEHSQDEDRYLLLGMSTSLQLLVVCHVHRQNDE
jgi:uncharacterized protein